MPGRKYSAGSAYKYGFNGKENDNEVKGEGNAIAFENRIYDPRLGIWFSLDPLQKKYPGETNYGFVSQNPIFYADEDGRDRIVTIKIIGRDKTVVRTITTKDVFLYTLVSVKGFGNDRYYKEDIHMNLTIDLRGSETKYTYSASLENKRETHMVDYYWNNEGQRTKFRGRQPGGFTLTSSSATNSDGPGVDATKGSDGSVNIDGILAGFSALEKEVEVLKPVLEDLPKWIDQSKNIIEAYEIKTNTEVTTESISEHTNPEANTKSQIKSKWSKFKPGTSVYPRNLPAGSNIEILPNGKGGKTTNKPATDTVDKF